MGSGASTAVENGSNNKNTITNKDIPADKRDKRTPNKNQNSSSNQLPTSRNNDVAAKKGALVRSTEVSHRAEKAKEKSEKTVSFSPPLVDQSPKLLDKRKEKAKPEMKTKHSALYEHLKRSKTDVEFLKFNNDQIRYSVERALNENRVFLSSDGNGSKPIYRALRKRYFVKKLDPVLASRKSREKRLEAHSVSLGRDDLNKNHRSAKLDRSNSPDQDNKGSDSEGESVHSDDDSQSVVEYMSKLVRNTTPSLIWTTRPNQQYIKRASLNTQVNHYPTTSCFTTKSGLTATLKNMVWKASVSEDEFYPRCYRIANPEERQEFIEDFRLTACVSVIRLAAENSSQPSPKDFKNENESENGPQPSNQPTIGTDSSNQPLPALTDETNEERQDTETVLSNLINQPGNERPKTKSRSRSTAPTNQPTQAELSQIDRSLVEFAMTACEVYLKQLQFEDLDKEMAAGVFPKHLGCSETKWQDFTHSYYKLVHERKGLQPDVTGYQAAANDLLDRIRRVRPMTDVDGVKNIWICKPGAMSRGRGISCQTHLNKMLTMASATANVGQRENKVVVQKYIERAFLIYSTKFDIRQWFLVTEWNPLTVWFYKDCYVRLCSRPYSLEDLDIGSHLSNNSIQAYIENEHTRPKELPEENMWTSDEFESYLRKLGYGKGYREKIYPRMKQILVWTMLCSQENMESQKGCFELYGADFVIGDDLSVWLLEINSCPALGASTHVTKRLCANVLEDTIKVVIDRKEDKGADTGQFELAFKQDVVSQPIYCGQNFLVEGTHIRIPGTHAPQSSRSASVGHFPNNFTNLRQKTDVGRSPPPSSRRPKQTQGSDETLMSQLRNFTNGGFLTSRSHSQNRPVMQQIASPAEIHEIRAANLTNLRSHHSNQVPSVASRMPPTNSTTRDKDSVLRHLASHDFNLHQRKNSVTTENSRDTHLKSGVRQRSPLSGAQNGGFGGGRVQNIAPRPTPSTSLSCFHDNGPLTYTGDRFSSQHGKLIAQTQAVAVQKIYGGKNNGSSNPLNKHVFGDTNNQSSNGRVITNSAFTYINPKSIII